MPPKTPLDHPAHRASEERSSEARSALARGESTEAQDHYWQAAILEEQAAKACDPALGRWVGLLARSAAALWQKADRPTQALRVIDEFLANQTVAYGFVLELLAMRETLVHELPDASPTSPVALVSDVHAEAPGSGPVLFIDLFAPSPNLEWASGGERWSSALAA